jgi:hypothetical protein
MAEIKSAIELAMEKTKQMKLSSEEKEKIKEDEIHSKAQGLVNRFLEVDFHLKEVEKELLKYHPNQRKEMEKLMIRYLSEAIQLDRENDLVFDGIEAFQKEKGKTNQKIKDLLENYRERKKTEYQNAVQKIQLRLAAHGISGSAVQPKVEGSREWEEALAQLKKPYEKQLQLFKQEFVQS